MYAGRRDAQRLKEEILIMRRGAVSGFNSGFIHVFSHLLEQRSIQGAGTSASWVSSPFREVGQSCWTWLALLAPLHDAAELSPGSWIIPTPCFSTRRSRPPRPNHYSCKVWGCWQPYKIRPLLEITWPYIPQRGSLNRPKKTSCSTRTGHSPEPLDRMRKTSSW